jgi:5-deoxy-glucuronate isomerase
VTAPLYLPRGSAAEKADPVAVTPELAGWSYSGLRVIELAQGERRELRTGPAELAVLPLAGGCVVECDSHRFTLEGRDHPFARVTDFAYLPMDAEARISSPGGGRFALPSAVGGRRTAPGSRPTREVPVELRGAGQASRQVNNFLAPDAFPADRLVAVEVLTPGGNWSSYPPHKHDQQRPPEEAQLEEIYYFEIARSAGGSPGLGFHRLYTADGEINLTETVADGDVVLIPRGYHGPSVAAPGYHMYYLNVLAGPAPQRSMAFCDDPAHGWVRASWAGQPVDPRLPLTGPGGSSQ